MSRMEMEKETTKIPGIENMISEMLSDLSAMEKENASPDKERIIKELRRLIKGSKDNIKKRDALRNIYKKKYPDGKYPDWVKPIFDLL